MDEVERAMVRHLAVQMKSRNDFMAETIYADLREYQKNKELVNA